MKSILRYLAASLFVVCASHATQVGDKIQVYSQAQKSGELIGYVWTYLVSPSGVIFADDTYRPPTPLNGGLGYHSTECEFTEPGKWLYHTCATNADKIVLTPTNTQEIDVKAAPPTATITSSGARVTVGSSVQITATYIVDKSYTLNGSKISAPIGDPALDSTAALATRSYTFTPSAIGVYTFTASMVTNAPGHDAWKDYASVLVDVTSAPSSGEVRVDGAQGAPSLH